MNLFVIGDYFHARRCYVQSVHYLDARLENVAQQDGRSAAAGNRLTIEEDIFIRRSSVPFTIVLFVRGRHTIHFAQNFPSIRAIVQRDAMRYGSLEFIRTSESLIVCLEFLEIYAFHAGMYVRASTRNSDWHGNCAVGMCVICPSIDSTMIR